ncbi:hypothetical protein FRB97_008969, partial [Tulasnella sp. 331]
IYGIASGLEYLQTHEVVHGDLKTLKVSPTEQLDPLICDLGTTNYVHGAARRLGARCGRALSE